MDQANAYAHQLSSVHFVEETLRAAVETGTATGNAGSGQSSCQAALAVGTYNGSSATINPRHGDCLRARLYQIPQPTKSICCVTAFDINNQQYNIARPLKHNETA